MSVKRSFKHIEQLAGRAAAPSGLRFGLEHPRGRVSLQERHARLPPWLVRLPYRALIAPTACANRRGLISRHFVGGPTLLDEIMPETDVNEVHDLFVEAPPPAVYSALIATTGSEVRLLGPLMALRELPAWLVRREIASQRQLPVLEALADAGFVELGEEPGREIVLGAVGRFWKLTANAPLRLTDRAAFLAFDEPGYAKAVMSFLVRSEGEGSRLITETRVAGTDVTASRSWLAAIRRRVADPRRSSSPDP